MPFFGFFWVNSWVSCLLGYSQGLFRVPDYLTSTLPARVLSVVGSPLESYNPLFIQASGESIRHTYGSGVRGFDPSLAALPKLDFQAGLGSRPYPSNKAQPSFQAVSQPDGLENRLKPALEQKKDSRRVGSNLPSSSKSKPQESGRVVSKAHFSKRIMQLMQGLFKWPQRLEGSVNPKPKPTVVVRIGDNEEVIAPPVSGGLVAQRGFWLYSLMRPGGDAASRLPKEQWPQVLVNGHLITRLPNWVQAKSMAQTLHKILSDPNLDANQVQPAQVDGVPGGKLGGRVLFAIDEALALQLKRNGQLLAIEWVNNLRTALGKAPLTLVQAQSLMYGLVETEKTFKGYASWYGDYFHGRPTATGEKYNQFALTAAHRSLPFHTYLKVTNLNNGNTVIVRVNDRGPYIRPRTLDLSWAAARCIKSEEKGVVPYSAVVMQPLVTP